MGCAEVFLLLSGPLIRVPNRAPYSLHDFLSAVHSTKTDFYVGSVRLVSLCALRTHSIFSAHSTPYQYNSQCQTGSMWDLRGFLCALRTHWIFSAHSTPYKYS